MWIRSLSLRRFKNIGDASLSFHPRYNVICGENAQGKTNLMEALWLFTGAKDFKGVREGDLIQQGEHSALLTLVLENGEGEREMTLTLEKGKRKRFTVGGVEKSSGAAVMGNLYAVVFSPAHLAMIQNGPEERRRFLDSAICQVSPTYLRALAEYRKILLQRNSLLKDARFQSQVSQLLEVFDPQLAKVGSYLIKVRRSYLSRLMEQAAPFYQGMTGGRETLSCRYETKALEEGEEEGAFLERLVAARQEDLASLNTSLGPHRDDLAFAIDGMDARRFGSQGQQRSCVLALKLSESRILRDMTGEDPVVLLDDVTSELDEGRKSFLLHSLEKGQIFITGCDPQFFTSFGEGRLFFACAGDFTEKT